MVIKSKTLRKEIEEAISKGAKVKEDNQKKKTTTFCLRLPVDLLDKIDESLVEYPEFSKTTFIIQAIREKLNKPKK